MVKGRKEKEQIINELADSLSRCTVAIATDYRGLTAKEMVQLRRELTELGVEYRVVKNTLTRFAVERANKGQLDSLLVGPLAIAFAFDEGANPAKVLAEHIRSSGSMLQIKGGVLGDRLLGPEEVSILATLPSRDILVSRLIGQLQAPAQALHNVLAAPLQGLLNVIQSRSQQMKGE